MISGSSTAHLLVSIIYALSRGTESHPTSRGAEPFHFLYIILVLPAHIYITQEECKTMHTESYMIIYVHIVNI